MMRRLFIALVLVGLIGLMVAPIASAEEPARASRASSWTADALGMNVAGWLQVWWDRAEGLFSKLTWEIDPNGEPLPETSSGEAGTGG
jgi:hypothetical protein